MALFDLAQSASAPGTLSLRILTRARVPRRAASDDSSNNWHAASGVARVGGQHPFVDAEDRERPIVFAVEIGVKYETGVGGAG